MASRGLQRLQDAILRRAAVIIQRDLADPRIGLVTVTRVKLAADFESCRIFWSCLEEGGARRATAEALESARPYVQRAIAETLRLRKAPIIQFEFDPAIEGVDRVTRLLRDVCAEDAAKHGPQADQGPAPDAAGSADPAPDAAGPADSPPSA